jgi:SAM-dependent methyltransferase
VTNEIAQRHRWTVETLAIDPTDHVLEIGCGYGVAVSLLCEELTTGTVTAIDRSETMIERASKRNTDYVSSGAATFQTAAVETVDFGDTAFDTIFAVNVGLFWNHPEKGLPVVKNHLWPDGAFYIFGSVVSLGRGRFGLFRPYIMYLTKRTLVASGDESR